MQGSKVAAIIFRDHGCFDTIIVLTNLPESGHSKQMIKKMVVSIS
jgi:hypothetical protein